MLFGIESAARGNFDDVKRVAVLQTIELDISPHATHALPGTKGQVPHIVNAQAADDRDVLLLDE